MPIADGQITFLPVTDLGVSRPFYEGILGLELVVDQGTCLIFRVTGDAFVGICEHLEPIEGRSVILTIVTDDVDGWYRTITDAGWTVGSAPEHNDRYGIYHTFVHDPDGNWIEIQRFDDPEWAASRS
jgi:catechol 2,3-dioxygenase-like lactoylglutathione lyase family enzyme